MKSPQVVIVGGGPAGLTAAYELCKAEVSAVVLEKDDTVGGLARTVDYKGYRFDIGGHRFFTKVPAVEALWREVLSDADFLHRPRLSRIYYNRKFLHYPLRPANALWGSGLLNSCLIFTSFIWAKLFPHRPETTFEQWVSNRFGAHLYRTFFKTYTEKVWGMPGSQISAEWAAQRIQGLSLGSALKNALLPQGWTRANAPVIKTLIETFDYPRLGPGMMWQRISDLVQQQGQQVRLRAAVERLLWSEAAGRIEAVEIQTGERSERVEGSHFISSMPLRELLEKLWPPPPPKVLQAARSLKYRDFLTVALIVDRSEVFPDNWIYIHDPDVQMGRIQNFKNWSADMVPDPDKTCLGLEYFCHEGDVLWSMSDSELLALGRRELEQLGLAQASEIVDGTVVRMPKAYPVYDATYAQCLGTVREFLAGIENLQVVGRNGMHRYNNQDHSMLTAMLAVQNILGAHHDLFAVNIDQEYHEELRHFPKLRSEDARLLEATQPQVPAQVQGTGPGVS